MEELLEKYKENPAIAMIYFPKELNRTETLRKGKILNAKKKNGTY